MPSTKKLSEWERQKGLVVHGNVDEDAVLSEKEFDALCEKNRYTGVAHEDRIAFLKKNKYPITRANLIDSNLSARTKKELANAND